MRNIVVYERSLLRICRNATILLIFITINCCAGPRKPDTKAPDSQIEENWIVRDPFPSATLAVDIILRNTIWEIEGVVPRESWMVVEDVQPTAFKIKDVVFVSFFERNEFYISGQEMRRRAALLHGNLGLVDAKYLLEHQVEIPVVFQNYYIVFPGTVLQNSFNRRLYVPVLYWLWPTNSWDIYFAPLDNFWYEFKSLSWSDSGCVVVTK